MLDSLSPPRRRLFLGLAGALTLALVLTLAAVVLRHQPERAVARDDQGPVLLVPGYGGDETGLQDLARALRADGRTVQIVHLVGDGRGDLRQQANHLGDVARRAISETGAASVDVIGYSAGGVVARWWVRFEDGAGLARRVVTISSPHHGTDTAALAAGLSPEACPIGCQQLVPDSDLLRRLNAGDETPAGPDWVSLWSVDDQTVTPPDSAVLEGARDVRVQDVCPGLTLSHAQMPRSPAVIEIIRGALGELVPTGPTAAVCA